MTVKEAWNSYEECCNDIFLKVSEGFVNLTIAEASIVLLAAGIMCWSFFGRWKGEDEYFE